MKKELWKCINHDETKAMEAKGIPSLSHVHHAQVREQTTANLGHPAVTGEAAEARKLTQVSPIGRKQSLMAMAPKMSYRCLRPLPTKCWNRLVSRQASHLQ